METGIFESRVSSDVINEVLSPNRPISLRGMDTGSSGLSRLVYMGCGVVTDGAYPNEMWVGVSGCVMDERFQSAPSSSNEPGRLWYVSSC